MDQIASAEVATTGPKCSGIGCDNPASKLMCADCRNVGMQTFFCDQTCYKKNWKQHKAIHPFHGHKFSGPLRPAYPLSPRRVLPPKIKRPDYAEDGDPKSERIFVGRHKIKVLTKEEQAGVRKVCRLAREVLDIAAREVRPGVTTDYIDQVVHQACIERSSYPSPLNYCHFPKSVCTSPNEVICHGIPDQRPLEDGDIVNIDVTLYHGGYHGDLNETYYVGESAVKNPDNVRVVEASRDCLDEAIKLVKPGALFRDFGNTIEKVAKSRDCQVVKTYCGHGIHSLFHCAPTIPHYAKNKAIGEMKPGMCFTVEPMITLGSYKDETWPDNWTSVTRDGSRTAQFEHQILVTETGFEVLTARLPDSPGGKIAMPVIETNGDANGAVNGTANGASTEGTASAN